MTKDYNNAPPKPNFHVRLNHLYEGYPASPPYSVEPYEKLWWYYNQNKGWGCWVMSDYKGFATVPPSYEEALPYPADINSGKKEIYKSPIPFHEADVPNSYRAHMTWYVDLEGWGRYVYLSRTYDPGTKKYMYRHVLITKR